MIRSLVVITVAFVVGALASITVLTAQESGNGNDWTAALTPWGHPDLQGVWVSADTTPIETPDPGDQARLASLSRWFPGSDFTTDRVAMLEVPQAPGAGEPVRRRSQIIDPSDGRLQIKSAAEAARDYKLDHLNDTYENHTLWERCISRGVALLVSPYDSAYRILQLPDRVVIFSELLHTTRTIFLDGRPHLGPALRSWVGSSRGRWDGNTLVVETTNLRAGSILGSATTHRRLRGLPHSEALHLMERFTRLDANTIDYRLTVTDANVYDTPWTAQTSLTAAGADYQMLESACHEGNMYLPNALRGARVEEAAAAQGGRQ